MPYSCSVMVEYTANEPCNYLLTNNVILFTESIVTLHCKKPVALMGVTYDDKPSLRASPLVRPQGRGAGGWVFWKTNLFKILMRLPW